MNNELWIILAQDAGSHVTIAGTYEVESDPLLGLRQILAHHDPEILNSTRFFAVRIIDGATVSLHNINALPSIDNAEEGRDGHSDAHCGGCRDDHESRSKHVCEARS